MRFQVRILKGRIGGSLLALAALGAMAVSGSCGSQKPKPNVVEQFLGHADRQCETEDQRAEIIRALTDMLNKPAADLRAQRYADYQGNKGAWPVTTLIERYFVPTQPTPAFDPGAFYRDVSKPEAQQAIRAHLSALQKEPAAH